MLKPYVWKICILVIINVSVNTFAQTVYPDDMRKIKDRDTLIVAQFSGERPGFFAYDDSNKFLKRVRYMHKSRPLIGYDIELAQKVAEELEVHLKIDRHYTSFNAVAQAVSEGKADIAISKLSVTTKRAQYLSYTKPYISLRIALMVNRMQESRYGIDKNNPLHACEKKGVKIGVLGKSSFEAHGNKNFPNAEIVSYENQEKLFQAALDGQVLAVLYEEYEIGKYMRKRPDMAIYCHTVYLPGKKDDIAMAVSGSNTTLQGFLATFIAKEQINTSVQELITNFIPEEDLVEVQSKTKNPFSTLSLYIAFLSALSFFLIWLSFTRKNRTTLKVTKEASHA